jgi:hypothetical protein
MADSPTTLPSQKINISDLNPEADLSGAAAKVKEFPDRE